MSLVDVVQDWGTTGYSGEVGARDWGRGYTARAVAEARLNSQRSDEVTTGAPWGWRENSAFDRIMQELDAFQVEYNPRDCSVSITRRSECKQNQSLDTAKLDEFLDEM